MLKAIAKGISQLNDRATRKILWICIAVAIVVFILLWSTVGFLLTHTTLFQIGWLETAVDVLGGLATLVLTWFLFPGVLSAVVGLFLENIADCVEAAHYPALEKTDGQPLAQSILSSVKFLAVFVILNILMLPFLLFGPVFPFVFYAVNGYLLSREYFELVALRRLSPVEVSDMRRVYRGRLFVTGVVIAFFMTLPIINLVTPVIATAAMVHLFQSWRRAARPVTV